MGRLSSLIDEVGNYLGVPRTSEDNEGRRQKPGEGLGGVALRVVVILASAFIVAELLGLQVEGWGVLAYLLVVLLLAAVWALIARRGLRPREH